MRRRAARVDANQEALVALFRRLGASVQSLSPVGGGCPDLLVGYQRRTYVVEVKDGEQPPSKRVLTPDQVIWRDNWRGQWDKAESAEEVERLVCAWAMK